MRDADKFCSDIQSQGCLRAYLRDAAGSQNTIVTRAPGRLDVMGGVADYSGALVAEATIAEAALIALRPRTDNVWRFWSLAPGSETPGLHAQLSLDMFFDTHGLRNYAEVQRELTGNPETRWAAYLAGCVFVLMAEGHAPALRAGANVLLRSAVPLGAGVSSSAAIEVAMMQALSVALGLKLDGVTLARLAQQAENKVVGAPCGIMDQMASALGVQNSLLTILCQPHEVQGTQRWPDDVRLFGINSNVVHSVGGGAYARARVAAFMARRLMGVDYLANALLPPEISDLNALLPETINGADFLHAYGETGDSVTRINPTVNYPVRAAAEHGICEHQRVSEFLQRLAHGDGEQSLQAAGTLMSASHESYTRIGLGSAQTDLLVALARRAGPSQGVYGAKITGGGSGGTVAFLMRGTNADQTIQNIAAQYQQQTGLVPQSVEAGQSPGAISFGFREVEN